MLASAQETTNDAAGQYALLAKAQDLAVAAGKYNLALAPSAKSRGIGA